MLLAVVSALELLDKRSCDACYLWCFGDKVIMTVECVDHLRSVCCAVVLCDLLLKVNRKVSICVHADHGKGRLHLL